MKKFKYSKAMKKANITWDEKTLDAYLTKPKKFVKGTKMTFVGLKKQEDRDNVIAYIKAEIQIAAPRGSAGPYPAPPARWKRHTRPVHRTDAATLALAFTVRAVATAGRLLVAAAKSSRRFQSSRVRISLHTPYITSAHMISPTIAPAQYIVRPVSSGFSLLSRVDTRSYLIAMRQSERLSSNAHLCGGSVGRRATLSGRWRLKFSGRERREFDALIARHRSLINLPARSTRPRIPTPG